MRKFITGFLYAVAISVLGLFIAKVLAESGIGDSKTNLFTAGWCSALFFKSLESRGWF